MKRPTAMARPRAMSNLRIVRILVIALLSLVLAACQATSPPTPSGARSPSPRGSGSAGPAGSADPSEDPTGSPGALPTLFPLPADLIPDGDIAIEPETARTAEPGRPYPYALGHCGVISPIDFNGSLWDPIGAQNGQGGKYTDDQLNELINSSSGTMTLVGADSAIYRTKSALILGLSRHQGPKTFPGCA